MADASYIDDELLDDPSLCEDDSEQQGLYEHFAVVADKGQTLLRLDKFLVARMEHCSRLPHLGLTSLCPRLTLNSEICLLCIFLTS